MDTDGHKKSFLKSSFLEWIADQAMSEYGLKAVFSPEALKQLNEIQGPAKDPQHLLKDMISLLWCSIDNDDSKDLDQITVAEDLGGGKTRVWVAIADVDALVPLGSPLDLQAQANTTSVYTGVHTFPMLPEKLSTDLTSLSENQERLALVVEMDLDQDGRVTASQVYRALVKNQAKLAYHSVGDWLEGKGPLPEAAERVKGMDQQLRLQDQAAQKLRALRHEQGALELSTLQPRPVTQDGMVVDMRQEKQNRAGELIEDFMVAANGTTARFLDQKGFPTLRRVVKVPERWERITEVAAGMGEKLPAEPDSKALSAFLAKQKTKDLLRFPDLSLTVVKLLGRGEYVMEKPGEAPLGHFGLAVSDYNHSTAPNRRYPDLVTQRLLKAALEKKNPPYGTAELTFLASHCTQQENAADKVERRMRKSAAASFLAKRIGEKFEAIVTGASGKGTWVRLIHPPVEGYLTQGAKGLDVGSRVNVKLLSVNVEKGWIDFAVIAGK